MVFSPVLLAEQEVVLGLTVTNRCYIIENSKIVSSGNSNEMINNDLVRRVHEHKHGLIEGFTKKYLVDRLVYYEETSDVTSAIMYEKRIKRWKREWKKRLIEENNPQWPDLMNLLIFFVSRLFLVTKVPGLKKHLYYADP